MERITELMNGLSYDLMGVAPIRCFDGLPSTEHPLSVFPDTRSVVVLGKGIHRGKFRGIEEGSLWNTPGRWLTDLDEAVRRIEEHGYECVPFLPTREESLPKHIENLHTSGEVRPAMSAIRAPRLPVRPGQIVPNGARLSVEYAAVAAGLGEIGYHGMFMSPRFGIRQALGMLMTDMGIAPTESEYADAICDSCMECVSSCPLEAISVENPVVLMVEGRDMKIGSINDVACEACPSGAVGDTSFFAGAEELHFDVVHNRISGDASAGFSRGGLPNRMSASCGRACIARFESTGSTQYGTPFRVRQAWSVRFDRKEDE